MPQNSPNINESIRLRKDVILAAIINAFLFVGGLAIDPGFGVACALTIGAVCTHLVTTRRWNQYCRSSFGNPAINTLCMVVFQTAGVSCGLFYVLDGFATESPFQLVGSAVLTYSLLEAVSWYATFAWSREQKPAER